MLFRNMDKRRDMFFLLQYACWKVCLFVHFIFNSKFRNIGILYFEIAFNCHFVLVIWQRPRLLAKSWSRSFFNICCQLKVKLSQGIALWRLVEFLKLFLCITNKFDTFFYGSPFLSRCFLLPLLCQATMTVEGAKALAFTGSYKAVSFTP